MCAWLVAFSCLAPWVRADDWPTGGEAGDVESLLVPGAGVAFTDDGVKRRPPHDDAGQWTHMYGDAGNSACSGDVVGGNLAIQWFGEPGPKHMVDRHMRTMPPLVSQGRMFIPGLDRVIAVDAYNGAIQWEKSLPGATRIGILKDAGFMVADETRLYIAKGDHCEVIRAADGTSQVTYTVPSPQRDWGYLASVGPTLIGSTTKVGGSRRTINRAAILEGAYTDSRPIVCSDTVFAIDKASGTSRWRYRSPGAILNPTIASNRRSIFCIENPSLDFDELERGRVSAESFLDDGARVTRLSLADGQVTWRMPIAGPSIQNIYVICNDDKVLIVNSRIAGTVQYDIRCFAASDGHPLWTATQATKLKTGGDHGAGQTSCLGG